METFGLIAFLIAAASFRSSQSALRKIRELKNNLNRSGDIVAIKNQLEENVGKNVKFEFYETGVTFQNFSSSKIVFESNILCEVLEYDDTYVLVNAKLKTIKKIISEKYLIPLDNIKSITVCK